MQSLIEQGFDYITETTIGMHACEEADPLDPWGKDHLTYFANTREGELAGLIWLAERKPFYKFKEQLVWIYNLHVIPKYRRKGLARKLLAKADDWAVERGLNAIGCHTLDFNVEARSLYESSDYRLIATHKFDHNMNFRVVQNFVNIGCEEGFV